MPINNDPTSKSNTEKPTNKNNKPGMQSPFGLPWWYFFVAIVLVTLWQDYREMANTQTIAYSEFKTALAEGRIIEVEVHDDRIEGKWFKEASAVTSTSPAPSASTSESPSASSLDKNSSAITAFHTVRVSDEQLMAQLEAKKIKTTGMRPNFISQFLLAWILPMALLMIVWIFISRKLNAGRESMFGFGRTRARVEADSENQVTFANVAGCDEAKFELQEVVDFLKAPAKYEQMGARIPKGILLVGPPGTGKTLLAKAVAGEAGVPFFSISGSEFVEMFVGVGASRVRDLFEQAKKQAPAIIFLDEIDAIGRQRGVHMGVVNDEREQTLNQLLVELDGFAANAGVIVLAATNRPDVLDIALLRPGRFDRQVIIDAPDVTGREAILKVHSRGKPLADSVDLAKIARMTPGFSGADLANLLNEAALLTVRHGGKSIEENDIKDAVEKIIAGPERKSRRLEKRDREVVACHELGHALVAEFSSLADPVEKITIVPRGRAALGYTLQFPQSDRYLLTKEELLQRVRVALGGRAAEDVVFKSISTGAENDLQQATALVRQMICVYGMGKSMGLTHCAQKESPYLAAPGMMQRDCSEQSAREIDLEVREILDDCYYQAKMIIGDHRQQIDELIQVLLEKESLDGMQFRAFLQQKSLS